MEKLYNDIKENIKDIRSRIHVAAKKAGRNPADIKLMAVTKTVPPEIVNIAIDNGVTLLGENKAQELMSKFEYYRKEDVDIHFIGPLQTNKVKQVIEHVTMIHSLDRLSLAKEIEKQAGLRNKVIEVLIEVNIGEESTKSGVLPDNVLNFSKEIMEYPHLKLRGLMCIPPISDDKLKLIKYFDSLKQHLVDIREQNSDNSSVNVLSMGMSGDFETAIHCGSTIVRIGSALFGMRP